MAALLSAIVETGIDAHGIRQSESSAAALEGGSVRPLGCMVGVLSDELLAFDCRW